MVQQLNVHSLVCNNGILLQLFCGYGLMKEHKINKTESKVPRGFSGVYALKWIPRRIRR